MNNLKTTLLLISSLSFLTFSFTPNVFADDSCNTNSYCVNSRWYKTSNCVRNEDAYALCKEGGGEKCEITCTCDYTPTGEICNQANPNQGNEVNNVIGKVNPPPQVSAFGFGAAGISNFLSNILNLIYTIAGIAFLFMIIISAFQWIISGGDKEAVGKARGRLTNAIIGIFLLALSFVIIRFIGQITGFSFFTGVK